MSMGPVERYHRQQQAYLERASLRGARSDQPMSGCCGCLLLLLLVIPLIVGSIVGYSIWRHQHNGSNGLGQRPAVTLTVRV